MIGFFVEVERFLHRCVSRSVRFVPLLLVVAACAREPRSDVAKRPVGASDSILDVDTTRGAPVDTVSPIDAAAPEPNVPPDALVFASACVPEKIRIPAHVDLDCRSGFNAEIRYLRPLCVQGPEGIACTTEPRIACSNLDPVTHGDVIAVMRLGYGRVSPNANAFDARGALFEGVDVSVSFAEGGALSREASVVEDCCRTVRWKNDDESELVVLEGTIRLRDAEGRWLFHAYTPLCEPHHVQGDEHAQEFFPIVGPAAPFVPKDGSDELHGSAILRAVMTPSGQRIYEAEVLDLMSGPAIFPSSTSGRRLSPRPFYPPEAPKPRAPSKPGRRK